VSFDELILRSLQGDLSPEETRALAEWRRISADNERRYQQLAMVSSALEASGRSLPRTLRPTATEIIQREAEFRKAGRRAGLWRWLAPTAGAAAAILVAIATYLILNHRESGSPVLRVNEIVTGARETSTTRLADGSVVRLAPASRLVLPGDGVGREVELEGTAFFAVAKRDGAPFVVRTRAGAATVLGTRFELRASEQELRVVVVEGRVAVGDGDARVELGPGEMSYVGRGIRPVVVRVPNPREMVDWLGRVMLFEDTPLRDVAREIEQQYGVRVVIGDSALASHVVSASFTEQPVERVLSVVCQVVAAQCSMEAGVARIGPKP